MKIFEALAPGLSTTIQDLGRRGFSSIGVSQGGAYDSFAARCANLLVGNPESAPVLEITYQGPLLVAAEPVRVAITGADLAPSADGQPLRMWSSVQIGKGDKLAFGTRRTGCRAYLAVEGGFIAEQILGSAARDVRCGFGGIALTQGTRLEVRPRTHVSGEATIAREVDSVYESVNVIRIVVGPDTEYFKERAVNQFLEGKFKVTSRSNRSGYRLEGSKLDRLPGEMLSEPVLPGVIQVPPDGHPIILGPECQNVGGYPRLGCVMQADFPKLAQAFIHDELSFRAVSVEEAQAAWRSQERLLGRIRELCATPN